MGARKASPTHIEWRQAILRLAKREVVNPNTTFYSYYFFLRLCDVISCSLFLCKGWIKCDFWNAPLRVMHNAGASHAVAAL